MKTTFAPFRAWCTTNSIQSSIEIAQHENFRYAAMHDIDSLLLSTATTRDPTRDLLKIPLQACLVASSSEDLADRLLFERDLGDQSDFAPYVDTLPRQDDDSFFEGFPRFWGPERLDLVSDGGQLIEELRRERSRYNAYYQGDSSQKDKAWSLACVDSRSHFLPDGSYCLSPLLDMINHDPRAKSTRMKIVKDTETKESRSLVLQLDVHDLKRNHRSDGPAHEGNDAAFSLSRFFRGPGTSQGKSQTDMRSSKTIHRNEVRISYGTFSNLHLLTNYGFVPDNGENVDNVESVAISTVLSTTPIELSIHQLGGCIQGFERLERLLGNDREEAIACAGSEIMLAMEEAREGSERASKRGDCLVSSYLNGRVATLQAAIESIQTEFPCMEFA